jgi:hypothetical protein
MILTHGFILDSLHLGFEKHIIPLLIIYIWARHKNASKWHFPKILKVWITKILVFGLLKLMEVVMFLKCIQLEHCKDLCYNSWNDFFNNVSIFLIKHHLSPHSWHSRWTCIEFLISIAIFQLTITSRA